MQGRTRGQRGPEWIAGRCELFLLVVLPSLMGAALAEPENAPAASIRDSMSSARIVGVDFSAAADAGRKTWIAEGAIDAGGALVVVSLVRASELPGGAVERDGALAALVAWIAELGDAVVGMDFPFGLSRELVEEVDYPSFLREFGSRFATSADFRARCTERAGGRELKRAADVSARTPMSPYNLRLHRQTFHGIRDVVAPLVCSGAARAAPMCGDGAWAGPTLIEICPASTLKRDGLYGPYKGPGEEHLARRRAIVRALEIAGRVKKLSRSMRSRVLDDAGGDALDSVIAAEASARAWRDGLRAPGRGREAMVEGWVFV